MSRIVRLIALALFVGVIASKPAPIAGNDCECEVTQVSWPYVHAFCPDCFGGQICASTWLCTYVSCDAYEAGADCTFIC